MVADSVFASVCTDRSCGCINKVRDKCCRMERKSVRTFRFSGRKEIPFCIVGMSHFLISDEFGMVQISEVLVSAYVS